MQAPGPSRSMQRRSPGAEPGPPPNVPVRSISPAVGIAGAVAPRSSTASNRSAQSSDRGSGSTRRTNTSSSSAMPLSQIEKSVTHLLVATKQLLETLTQWSRGQATDSQVSDVYVRLGYEFNMACRAFTAINVDTSDLGNVPENLRHILEATLSQEASVESLEKYLPRIRDIIINLLHGLKRKQQRLRQKTTREKENGVGGEAAVGRTTSTSTTGSTSTGLTTLINEGLENGGFRTDARPDSSSGRTNSSPSRRFVPQRDQSAASAGSEHSSMSSSTMQNIPILPPYPGEESGIPAGPPANDMSVVDSFPPPPPPPKATAQQSAALAALQRGGDLERRASRRYSAYQISKHLGSGASGVPMLPPQNSPIPNRGRGELRESMRAVQVREALRHNRNTSSQSRTGGFDSSPVRVPSRVSEEKEAAEPEAPGSPNVQTPVDKYPQPSATLRGPPTDALPVVGSPGDDEENAKAPDVEEPKVAAEEPPPPEKHDRSFILEQSPPPPSKELTLFLQYKTKVKKFVLPEGESELSIGRLQLAFIEKFSWNTQQNGVDLPEIYIQDPVSGVRHELEDLSDIKDRTVLVLNTEPLDEVKRHIDEGFGSIMKVIGEVKQNVDEQAAALQRVSDRQQEAAKEIARLAVAPPTPPADSSPRNTTIGGPVRRASRGQVSEIQTLRRDLAVLRQTYSNFQSEIQGSMSVLRNKANNVKVAAAKASLPEVEVDSGHAYVTSGRKQLSDNSDRLVAQVDDLQDMVEDLRKDVVHRGVRPRPNQLETVAKDIQQAMKELKKMEEYLKQEKPVWTKIWEKELEDVCQGRDELKVMEDLIVDLEDDLEKASETFTLVEQATKEQMKDAGAAGGGTGIVGGRQFSRGLNAISNNIAVDPNAAKEGVLGEVRALQPNHEDRLEAIERAEKLRQKELELRRENPLKKELTNFVKEGKLKKSGGFEEVERARKAKDERIRREVWERQNGMIPEDPVGEEDEALATEEPTPVEEVPLA
ncbi:Actin interacting protein 3 [Pleurostoma richardsiae]|uniref:Actin interacting protein 3 n=1 Tax=Pleurostoma richardsiae TaxID=41990 RepID=A0AA38VG15_9PEZI|nr:Actin interacting protein 3 [Pleurostoma richardsiae]